ncbi:DNA-binding transcriptional regulator, MerR family [Cnuella takakiae]|uniref:DNA-binding transcriptional regulator, MerR family n=1 Tax=Cnuella takakiae TaxID=1302690 RepID=A0A1M5EUS4_9BACT|nr:MerR family transcriptional regulator [Cnuella takakiae]SHF82947.1 DNA-binding transcriptional regulator, MerR family [Cnuella takakiae]
MFDLPAPEEQPKEDGIAAPVQPAAGPELALPLEPEPAGISETPTVEQPATSRIEAETDLEYPLYPTLPEPEPFAVAEPEPVIAEQQPEAKAELPVTDSMVEADTVTANSSETEAVDPIDFPAQEMEAPAASPDLQHPEQEAVPLPSAAVETPAPEAVGFVVAESPEHFVAPEVEAIPEPAFEIPTAPAEIAAEVPVAVFTGPIAPVVPAQEAAKAATAVPETVSFVTPNAETRVQAEAATSEALAAEQPEAEPVQQHAPAAPEPIVALRPTAEADIEQVPVQEATPSLVEAVTTVQPEPAPESQPVQEPPAPQPVVVPSSRPYISFDIEVVETNEADIPREFLSGHPITPQGPKVKSTRGRKSIKATEAGPDKILVPEDEELFKKQYYPISEVAVMFGVNISQIRYWENEFPQLKPRKNGKGDRLFRPEDVKMLVLIHDLIRRRKYTLEGAKDYLKLNNGEDMRFPLIQQLQKLKGFLNELKANM